MVISAVFLYFGIYRDQGGVDTFIDLLLHGRPASELFEEDLNSGNYSYFFIPEEVMTVVYKVLDFLFGRISKDAYDVIMVGMIIEGFIELFVGCGLICGFVSQVIEKVVDFFSIAGILLGILWILLYIIIWPLVLAIDLVSLIIMIILGV